MNAGKIQEWLRIAIRHHQAGRWDEAARWYARARQAAPRNFDALHLDGLRALQQGKHDEALALLGAARKVDPHSAICALRLGVALAAKDRWNEAEGEFRAAMRLDGKLPEAPFHLGLAARRQGRLEEAVGLFEAAIALRPDYAEAHDRLGALLWNLRGPAAAEPVLRRATELDPNQAASWCNLGLSLLHLGQVPESLAALGKAVALNPRFDQAHAARGLALSKCYRPAAAAKAYATALEINPRNFEAHSARLMELLYEGRLGPAEMFAAHRRFGEAAEAAAVAASPVPAAADAPDSARRLRVGFLSPDLHLHSVAFFLEPILAHLDRAQFSVHLYNDKAAHDAMSDRLAALADGWKSTAGLPGDVLERLLREDRLDILIDLAGHTGQNRLPLFARRLAPVQATYLGYPDTTGLSAMDYRLVDAASDPEGEADPFCSERLLRFAPVAWSYRPPEPSPDPAPGPAAAGGHVTFGCFNNVAKISEATLQMWARVLAAVPGSRLLLKGLGLTVPALQSDFHRRMVAAGIAPERVTVRDRIAGVADHLAAYGGVDIALDTFPYHGTTTTCEALWMGVPVVTRGGDRHASRVGVSLLRTIGRGEWIGRNEDEYVAIAARLANEAAAVSGPRTALRAALQASPLMDHADQGARFGAALRLMWAEKTAACARRAA